MLFFSFFKRSEHSDTWLKNGPVGEIRNYLYEYTTLIFSYGLFTFLFCPHCPAPCRAWGFQGPPLNTRSRFPGGTWGMWNEESAARRAPVYRRIQRWETDPNRPKRRTWTSRNRDWCHLGGRICNAGNGTARSWFLPRRCTRKWCKMCLEKRKIKWWCRLV